MNYIFNKPGSFVKFLVLLYLIPWLLDLGVRAVLLAHRALAFVSAQVPV